MDDKYLQRFYHLIDANFEARAGHTEVEGDYMRSYINGTDWNEWFTSSLGLLRVVFGDDSPHYCNLKRFYDKADGYPENEFDDARGVLAAAMSDYKGGFYISLNRTVAAEVFGDFIALAKKSLEEGQKDVAAVLACAALEDALKRYATLNGLDVQNESMQQVVAALKSKGLVSGAQKSLLDPMPRIRDYAMHANWDKINREDVASIIGFVGEFLLSRFSM